MPECTSTNRIHKMRWTCIKHEKSTHITVYNSGNKITVSELGSMLTYLPIMGSITKPIFEGLGGGEDIIDVQVGGVLSSCVTYLQNKCRQVPVFYICSLHIVVNMQHTCQRPILPRFFALYSRCNASQNHVRYRRERVLRISKTMSHVGCICQHQIES